MPDGRHADWVYYLQSSGSETSESTDPDTGETVYEYSGSTHSTVSFSDIDYYYKDVVKKASEIAEENEEYIRNLAGEPPKSSDPPAVSISIRRVGDGPIDVLDPDAVILRNTGSKPTAAQKLVAGAVQGELNSIFNTGRRMVWKVDTEVILASMNRDNIKQGGE